ncbi:hypothetical protein D3273_27315 [Lichenibacterium minor]|uniref:Uncharacterized protein n=1 Tax=Lichenibacterium minor TaxID=2316528 RepID=A0A4V1RTT9_9HYPH|nr:hypothetical protein [Lichenibacterium minor]RYC28814.1 hypothetical protein D3273_27315 [Lichenibacterium minor]
MSPTPGDAALRRAFDCAVVDHFGGAAGQADAEEVVVAACTVAGSHIAGMRDPVGRGVLLAQAQWTLGRIVAEVAKADAVKGRGPHGT